MTDNAALYKEHSNIACISEGYKFLANNLLLVVKVLWPYIIITTMLSTALQIMTTKCNLLLQTSTADTSDTTSMLIALFAMIIPTMFFVYLTQARTFLMFRRLFKTEEPAPDSAKKLRVWKHDIKRSVQLIVKLLPYCLCLPIAISFIINFPIVFSHTFLSNIGASWVLNACITCLIGIAVILAVVYFCTPLAYTFYCSMMKPYNTGLTDEDAKATADKHSFKTAYRKGRKHLWKTLCVILLGSIITLLASAIFYIPNIIFNVALTDSMISSLVMDDSVSTPTGSLAMMFIGNALAQSCIYIIFVFLYCTLLYLYGDIYSQED